MINLFAVSYYIDKQHHVQVSVAIEKKNHFHSHLLKSKLIEKKKKRRKSEEKKIDKLQISDTATNHFQLIVFIEDCLMF